MRILYINAAGKGWAGYIEVPEGTTVGQLFAEKMVGENPEDFILALNESPTPKDVVLKEGDRVSFTAANHGGGKF